MNMLDVSNNQVTAATIGETAGGTIGRRTPEDQEEIVVDNNYFYENETPEGDEEKNQNSSRPLNR
tara:strand:+ start:1244 stop:1438 length:195 start_codon:yes stop_codon:yes gene_type:complete